MRFTQHELLELQEHIRGAAASATTCRQFAQIASDPDIRSFCEREARTASETATRLMGLFQQATVQ